MSIYPFTQIAMNTSFIPEKNIIVKKLDMLHLQKGVPLITYDYPFGSP